VPLDAAEALGSAEQTEPEPTAAHVTVITPALDVSRDVAQPPDQILDAVRGGEEATQPGAGPSLSTGSVSSMLPDLRSRGKWTDTCGSVGGGASRLLLRLGHAAAVALPFDRDNFRVVNDAVDQRRGGGRVRKDGGPFAKRQIRGQDQTPPFVAPADDLE